MISVLISLLLTARSSVRSRAALQLEVLALHHQLQVLNRSRPRRVRLAPMDWLLWAWLSHVWRDWRAALILVQPKTVVAWHRRGFRVFWAWKSRQHVGRPTIPADVRALIRTMSQDNPLWGAPRVHGELLKLGVDVSQATVAKYMTRSQRPPSQTWRTFLANHMGQIAAADFFVVPTVTCRLLFVLVILAHERRRIVHVAVTDYPTAAWTAQQLREAFPWNDVPRYLVRDRDAVFHAWATRRRRWTSGRSSRQHGHRGTNAYAERLIGSIRRECLDHVIVWNKRGLRRVLQAYVAYYQRSRTHLSLDKDSPVPRATAPPSAGCVVAIPQVGGLHHRYERRAA
jgi:hypothetical protein